MMNHKKFIFRTEQKQDRKETNIKLIQINLKFLRRGALIG